jgi:hypothetical protein
MLLAAAGAAALAACGGARRPADITSVSALESGSTGKIELSKRAARCDIIVDDVRTGRKSLIQETFHWSADTEPSSVEYRYFALPGVADGRCSLAFFPESGTSLSCQMDAQGMHYVQSDRTSLKEFPNKNHLIFRLSGVHLTIEVTCS